MNGYRVVWPQANRVELTDYTLPAPKMGEVLIQTEYSVISAGTEKAWLQAMPNTSQKFPQYPGYSASGRIIETGAGVDDLKIGDRVLCHYTGHASHAVKPAKGLVRIDNPQISAKEAAFAEIASISMQGVRKAKLELGQSVLIMGLGILGQFAVQLASLSGGLPVIAADLDEARRKLALGLGADAALNPTDSSFQEQVRQWTEGRNANAVVEVTGVGAALQQALTVTARQGRVILLGCTRINDIPIDLYQYVHKPGISLIGAHQFVRPEWESAPGYWTRQDEFRVFLRLLAAGKLQIAPLISETVVPEQAPVVYQRLIEQEHAPLGIVFDWTSIHHRLGDMLT